MKHSPNTASLESTPGLTETSIVDVQDESDEDARLQEIIKQEPLTEEQKSFNQLSRDKKLAKLNSLVEQSKMFSSIISDTLFAKTVSKEAPEDVEEPPKKKGRAQTTRKNKKGFVAVELSSEAKQTKEKLEQHDIRISQPAILRNCEMRDYQLQGMNWLITLYENGLNGILADEMGLGKTLQSISMLAFLYEQGIEGPFLITCPLSTCSNWLNEIERFAPDIPVLSYVGPKDERKKMRDQLFSGLRNPERKNKKTPAIVVSSYEMIIRDRSYLDKIDWKFLIVDEGHRLKNSSCLLIKELKRLRTSNRLLLTGTPLQNNLDELWSLLNFILPDIFHDIDLFQQWFDFSRLKNLKNEDNDDETTELINNEIEKSLVTNLHSILKPFLLRRLKKDVIKGLPPKREYIIYANLTQRQTSFYKSALHKNLKEVLIRHFFQEYLTVNNYDLGDKEFIKEFIENQLHNSKLNSKSSLEFIKNSMSYDKSKKRSTRSQIKIISLDSDDEDDEFLMSESEDEEEMQGSGKTRSSARENFDDPESLEAKASIRMEKLESLWDKVKKELENKKLQNLMMQLRLICDSPYLFFFPWEDETKVDTSFIENSGKMIILNQLVPKLIGQNHKVLIFSQFTRMLDLIQDWCDFNDLKACRIDGSTDQALRTEEISNFNNDPSFKVFLLSTRAGGLGLNLTAADTVILFDSDWNPQVDLQAMDRVHRIGQTKPVIIYRLATMNTIEQVLLSKADSKRKLEKLVISMGKFETIFNEKKALNKSEGDSLTNELGRLLAEKTVFENNTIFEDNDFKLNEQELLEILDRSPESYERSREEVNGNPAHKRIAIFETVNAME